MNIKIIVIVGIAIFVGLIVFGYIKVNLWLLLGLPLAVGALIVWLMFFNALRQEGG